MRIYGKDTKEDPTRCIVEVAAGQGCCLFQQCSRKRGHGVDGVFCKQHAAMAASGKRLFVPHYREEDAAK